MAIHWTIPFASRRSSTAYFVQIYAAGSAQIVTLYGAASPIETQEDDDEDMFTPIRKQSGTLRIVDDDDRWSDIIPASDTDRFVRLVNASGAIFWQGFMQAQTYGNGLYEGTQETEFPLQGLLSVLSTKRPTTSDAQPRNFAYIINMCVSAIESFCSAVGASAPISRIYVQGGADALTWLMKKVDWQNFFDSDENEDLTAKYTYYDMLEDVCQYWGWTARVWRNNLYLLAVDDAAEQNIAVISRSKLTTLAGGTSILASTIILSSYTLSGSVFASMDNDEYVVRGPNKATVKADVNEQDILFQVLPPSVQSAVDENLTYAWYGKDSSTLVGYFSTPIFRYFGDDSHYPSKILQGAAVSGNGFARRQYYISEEGNDAEKADVIVLHGYSLSTPQVQLQTKKQMNFSQGALTLKASIFYESTHERSFWIWYRIGIGQTHDTAKWFYMDDDKNVSWSESNSSLLLMWASDGNLLGSFTWFYQPTIGPNRVAHYPSIPLAAGLEGYIFVDFYGARYPSEDTPREIEIGNFEVEYSRDTVYIDSSDRSRTMEDKRQSTREYTASSNAEMDDQWNADCIFASDNNMKYGYGLLMNTDGSYMGKAQYAGVQDSQWPEQHLANRVMSYWSAARRKLSVCLQSNMSIGGTNAVALSPVHKISFDNKTYYPVSINQNWRDDETELTMMEINS